MGARGAPMTWSIVARDPETGWHGVAAASCFFAVGALVPHVRGGRCAVATQAFVSPPWGIEAADRLAAGEPTALVLADLAARDPAGDRRQIHAVDAAGRSAALTGTACPEWSGHVAAEGASVAGNTLEGPEVVARTLATYQAGMALPFPERLLAAMEAGEAAGGDRRGRQSACLRIHRGEAYPCLDLRADDHADPLAELRRLLAVAGERSLAVADTLPTAARPGGAPGLAPEEREARPAFTPQATPPGP